MNLKKIILLTFLLSGLVNVTIAQVADNQSSDDTASLRKAVEAYPDSLPLHKQYIRAFVKSIAGANYNKWDSATSLLEPQYQSWMQQFPHSATVPFAMGEGYGESPKARPYLLKAVELNPKLGDAWIDLALDAERRGDQKTMRDDLQKAVEADPSNADYQSSYAFSFENSDPAKWKSLLYDLVKRFPNSERGAQALYWMGFETGNMAEKLKIYEQLRTLYPPDKFQWSDSGMGEYFYILTGTNPSKALALAEDITKRKLQDDSRQEWQKNLAFAQKIVKARQLIEKRQAGDAVKLLSGVTIPWWSDGLEGLNLLKAEAVAKSGNIPAAYDSLVNYFAKMPHDKTQEAILHYGGKLGKDAAQVDADVWKQREALSKTAHPFTLMNYLTGDSVSLSDYRGKLVLLTFWFPGCGPCRGEFPHFRKILDEFQSQGHNIVFLGINVLPEQNEFVVPFMKGTGFGFTPLAGNSDWAHQAYGVRGEPTNFLIDSNGKIIFTGFMIQGPSEEQMLRLMIGSMVKHQG